MSPEPRYWCFFPRDFSNHLEEGTKAKRVVPVHGQLFTTKAHFVFLFSLSPIDMDRIFNTIYNVSQTSKDSAPIYKHDQEHTLNEEFLRLHPS